MHQHTSIGNIISMVILNLEVIDRYRGFKDFMLDLLDNDIFTIDENKDIASTKVYRSCPALNGRVERMGGCCNDLFAVNEYVDKLVSFVDVGLNDFLKRNVSGVFIPCPDEVAPKPLYRPTRSPYAHHPPAPAGGW